MELMGTEMMINPHHPDMDMEGYTQVKKLDEEFVGTLNYMGLGWFWNYEYRHYLRDATFPQRKKVHKKFVKANLPTDGESPAHLSIIEKVLKIEGEA